MTCPDLCTAEKCRELEDRIRKLEEDLELLTNNFNTHLSNNIPTAHSYTPKLEVESKLSSGTLTTSVKVDDIKQSDSVDLSSIPIKSVKAEFKKINEGFEQFLTVTVNGTEAQTRLSIPKPSLDLEITPINDSTFKFDISLGDRKASKNLYIAALEKLLTGLDNSNFAVTLDYLSGLLTVSVTIDGVTKSASTYLSGLGNNNNSSGGGGSNVTCEGLQAEFKDRIELVLQAIAKVETKVVNIEKYVTIDIEGEAYNELECPEGDSGGGEGEEGEEAPKEYGTLVEYKGKGLLGIHQLVQIINTNLVKLFEASCDKDGVVAFPAWWQTRLMADVPQTVCIFRKGGSSTYHSIAIPHPATTEKPGGAVLPPYTKGNYMGMVTCRDNSKFIINCESEAEAERMCNAAIAKIDPEFLETPPRVYIGKRKGQAVSVNPMTPTSIEYYSKGQQSNIPDWRVRLNKIEPE